MELAAAARVMDVDQDDDFYLNNYVLSKTGTTFLSPMMDFRKTDMKSHDQLIIPVFRRLMGILFQHQQLDDLELEIFIKRTHDSPTAAEFITPDYPSCNISLIGCKFTHYTHSLFL